MAINSVSNNTRTVAPRETQATTASSTSQAAPEPAQETARLPVPSDVMNGVRERVQGVGDAIRDRIQDLAPGEPVAGTWKPCGRGKCTAHIPTRGLGGGNVA